MGRLEALTMGNLSKVSLGYQRLWHCVANVARQEHVAPRPDVTMARVSLWRDLGRLR